MKDQHRRLIMGKRSWIAAAAALASTAALVSTPAAAYTYEHTPQQRHYGQVWVPGHWEWQGNGHVWVPGHYLRSRPGWARRDRDHDGIPNRFDRDIDGDGVPNRYDRAPNNPYRR
jgi:hypothetical protein